jgi:hypothetical protein
MKIGRKTMTALVLAFVAAFAVSLSAQDGKKTGAKAPARKGALSVGYRGFSMTLSGSQLAFLNKGDRVDVLVTFDAKMKDDAKEKVTATILQNVVVLGIRQPAKLDQPGVVELEVNPNEGQYAALSVAQGAVQLLLRAEGDTEMHPMEMASFRKLFR